MITVTNETMLQFFEWYLPDDARHWRRVAEAAESLSQAGITSVWLPPAYKGAGGIHDVGYAPYDFYDLGEFMQKGTIPTKYGPKEDYLEAAGQLQAFGIKVYADIVFDHMMGADETEVISAEKNSFTDRTKTVEGPREIVAWTRFTYPGRAGTYSDFVWDRRCFSGVDWDQRQKEHAIFEFENKDWDEKVDREHGNFDYLMGANLDMDDPRVVAELDHWGRWYLETCGLDGFRLDAVKHINFPFFISWLGNRRKEAGKRLFAVGEYWHNDIRALTNYLDASGNLMHLFDVPLHYNLCRASNSNGEFDMRMLFEKTLADERPSWAVTFVDNHDTQPGQSLSSWVGGWFKLHSYALILLRREGIPCVFYGDLYGIPTAGIQPVGAGLYRLLKVRRHLAYGEQIDYLDHPDLAGWVRTGDEEHPLSGLAVVLTNRTGGSKKMCIGAWFAGRTFVDLLGHRSDRIVIGEDGNGEFPVNDGSVSIWGQEGALDYLA